MFALVASAASATPNAPWPAHATDFAQNIACDVCEEIMAAAMKAAGNKTTLDAITRILDTECVNITKDNTTLAVCELIAEGAWCLSGNGGDGFVVHRFFTLQVLSPCSRLLTRSCRSSRGTSPSASAPSLCPCASSPAARRPLRQSRGTSPSLPTTCRRCAQLG